MDVVPVGHVGGVKHGGAHPGAFCGGYLVAHEGEQRGDNECWPGPLFSQQQGGDEVDGGFSPPGALDDEHAAAVCHERFDRLVLPGMEGGVWVVGERS